MEVSCSVWMRRVLMASYSTNSLLRMSFSSSSISTTIPPISFPSLKPPLSLALISHRRSLSVTPHFSASPLLSPLDHESSSPSIDDKRGNTRKGLEKVLLKGMRYTELEKWVKSHGYRPGQALMLWKRLYGDNIWAQCSAELEGMNKGFTNMLSELAEFKAMRLKDILTASDGTRKGMGEPLHNIENVVKAADIMVHEQGLHFSPRKITVSTSGLVPQLRRFLGESNCALAVSLNATTDEVRNWIMPINRKYNLELLLETLRQELRLKQNYKVLFEYVMLAGVNDSTEDAKRLIDLVQGIPCKINLISFNPHCGSQFKPTRDERMIEFRNILAEAGCVVFMRPSRGDDQMAACGQLGNPGEIQAPLLRVPAKFQAALQPSA